MAQSRKNDELDELDACSELIDVNRNTVIRECLESDECPDGILFGEGKSIRTIHENQKINYSLFLPRLQQIIC